MLMSTYNYSLLLSNIDLCCPWDAYFNLLDYVTHAAQCRDYIPAPTCVMGQRTFDRTASTVGMVTGQKSKQGFACEIRAATVFILFYFTSFLAMLMK